MLTVWHADPVPVTRAGSPPFSARSTRVVAEAARQIGPYGRDRHGRSPAGARYPPILLCRGGIPHCCGLSACTGIIPAPRSSLHRDHRCAPAGGAAMNTGRHAGRCSTGRLVDSPVGALLKAGGATREVPVRLSAWYWSCNLCSCHREVRGRHKRPLRGEKRTRVSGAHPLLHC